MTFLHAYDPRMRKREIIPSLLVFSEETKAARCVEITVDPILKPCKEQLDFVEKFRIIGNERIEPLTHLELNVNNRIE